MTRTSPEVELLARVELFAELGPDELRHVAALVKPMEFPTGETLTDEGTQGGRFHVIESGTADVVIGGETRGTLGPGDSFGEISLVDGGPRAATVIATSPVRTASIAEWNFRSLLRSNAAVASNIALVLCRRLRAAQAVDPAE
jgi:CRP-like cAMP-binding protein